MYKAGTHASWFVSQKDDLYKGNGRSGVKNLEALLNVSGCSSSRLSLLKTWRSALNVFAESLSVPRTVQPRYMFVEVTVATHNWHVFALLARRGLPLAHKARGFDGALQMLG
jgi:hypothetical protein